MFLLAVGAAWDPPGVGKALAWAAGPALATLEGKITIAAGPQARSRARIFLGKSRSAGGDPHGGCGGLAASFWGAGVRFGGLWVGKLRHELRGRGSGKGSGGT